MKHTLLKTALMLSSLFTASVLRAQTVAALQQVLAAVETNNTTLRAAVKETNAQRLANQTATNLPDPEVEFGYLWGGPSSIGKRKDVSVSQSLDLATLSGQRKRLAEAQNEGVDLQYRVTRQSVLAEAADRWLSLVYCNARLESQHQRTRQAEDILRAMQRRLKAGEGNVLDVNQARLSYTAARAEQVRLESEQKALQTQLDVMNGGIPLSVQQASFDSIAFPANFDAWYADVEKTLPLLATARQDVTIARRSVAVIKAEGLPSLSIGYMGEFTRGERYQGPTVGVSIPLWSNRGKVRQAKLLADASADKAQDVAEQTRARLRSLYLRADGLRRSLAVYRSAEQAQPGCEALRKALDGGELSLVDYLTAVGMYYDSASQRLDAEYAYWQAWIELTSVCL